MQEEDNATADASTEEIRVWIHAAREMGRALLARGRLDVASRADIDGFLAVFGDRDYCDTIQTVVTSVESGLPHFSEEDLSDLRQAFQLAIRVRYELIRRSFKMLEPYDDAGNPQSG
jgi:hypothetical protein